jgi:hypothetical protein
MKLCQKRDDLMAKYEDKGEYFKRKIDKAIQDKLFNKIPTEFIQKDMLPVVLKEFHKINKEMDKELDHCYK